MLGDNAEGDRQADVRFLVGTNADLRAAVRAGRFREDSYYRVNVLPVRLLPLSERLDEVPGWAEYMLNLRHQEAGGEGAVRLEPDAMKRLVAVPLPGNLRQLDNIVRRAYALLLGGRVGGGSTSSCGRTTFERALDVDGEGEPSALPALLWRAARAFVQEAERRQGSDKTLPLELTKAFGGMVLGAAVQMTGNREEAFTLLGEQDLVSHRNHHRRLKQGFERVRKLLRVLGGEVDRDLEAMLDADEEPGEAR